jgi:hypothetical protein
MDVQFTGGNRAVSTRELNVHEVKTEKTTSESCAPVAPRQRFEKLLRAVFEGHKEFLGLTPD